MARYVILEDVVKWLEIQAAKNDYGSWDYTAALEIAAGKLESGYWQKELNEAEANEALPPR